MIAEIIPGAYDVCGKRIPRPRKQHGFTQRPMGAFLSQPLKVACRDLDEIRAFLVTCQYVSDSDQFGVLDHWMLPQEFEQIRKGDCEDFALWAWRQLLTLGYEARFVTGSAGRYGAGHAWLTFCAEGKTYLMEPQAAILGKSFPRLDTMRYKPAVSVEADGVTVRFYEHTTPKLEPDVRVLAPLVWEWLAYRARRLFLIPRRTTSPSDPPR